MMKTTFLFTNFTAKEIKTHAAKLNAQVLVSFQQLTLSSELGRTIK